VQALFVTEQEEKNLISRTEKCLLTCRNYLLNLQTDVTTEPFAQITEEIQFFKEIWPKFYSFFLYYQKLHAIEINRPVGHRSHEETFLYKELEHLKDFFEENRFIYHYYRASATYLDEKLFTTFASNDQVTVLTPDPHADNKFTTQYSDIVARIIAHDRLQKYLQQEISKLQAGHLPEPAQAPPSTGFLWTGAKVWLGELIYALHAAKVINNGQTHLNKVAEQLSHLFNIPIGNIYKMLEEIRLRKKNPTAFLDMLKIELLLQMERDNDTST
jgi:hypothetical protein